MLTINQPIRGWRGFFFFPSKKGDKQTMCSSRQKKEQSFVHTVPFKEQNESDGVSQQNTSQTTGTDSHLGKTKKEKEKKGPFFLIA